MNYNHNNLMEVSRFYQIPLHCLILIHNAKIPSNIWSSSDPSSSSDDLCYFQLTNSPTNCMFKSWKLRVCNQNYTRTADDFRNKKLSHFFINSSILLFSLHFARTGTKQWDNTTPFGWTRDKNSRTIIPIEKKGSWRRRSATELFLSVPRWHQWRFTTRHFLLSP